jgi:hypothetical protein
MESVRQLLQFGVRTYPARIRTFVPVEALAVYVAADNLALHKVLTQGPS